MDNPIKQVGRYKSLKINHQSENLTLKSDNQHPLLNGLILENIFGYLKCQTNLTNFANYRIVCKVWNEEIVKFLRKDTQTNLFKIISPYPNGLGWTPSPDPSFEKPFHYKIPYPEVRPFQNIIMTLISCETTTDPNVVKWFKILGDQVKSLRFSAPLTCFCQNQFLERILKEWCPNLEHLELLNVTNIDSLLFSSGFLDKHANIICKGLKSLKISVDDDKAYTLCSSEDTIYNTNLILTINILKLPLKFSTWKLVSFIYEHGLNPGNLIPFPEIINTNGKIVSLPVKLNRNLDLSHLITYFEENSKETDGGIVGQIMKEIHLDKLCINGFNSLNRCHDLVIFFHVRPNLWRKSLRDLELDHFISKSLKELHVIAQLRFPLTRLQLGGIHLGRDNQEITRFFVCFSDTLEYLEIGGPVDLRDILMEPSVLVLPVLPKLKTFIHRNIEFCRLSAGYLWGSAPNLEVCSLKGTSFAGLNRGRFFGNTSEILSNSMKELKLNAKISGQQSEILLGWFPNLRRIELVLEEAAFETFTFFGLLGKSNVKHLKFEFLGYLNENRETLNECKQPEIWKPWDVKGLQSLELNNQTNLPFRLSAMPFSQANLRSLGLNNFEIFVKEEKELLKNLSHIPYLELNKTVYTLE